MGRFPNSRLDTGRLSSASRCLCLVLLLHHSADRVAGSQELETEKAYLETTMRTATVQAREELREQLGPCKQEYNQVGTLLACCVEHMEQL